MPCPNAGSGSAPRARPGARARADDGYSPAQILSADAAQAYHSTQIETFASISFTLETDGRLPSGQPQPRGAAELDEGDPADLAAAARS